MASAEPHPDALRVPESIFRAYDVRGIAGRQLTCSNIGQIGRAIGTLALEKGQDTLLFAADGRLSSPSLAAALQEGILSTGCNLVDLGIVPTPLLYFATHTSEWPSGLMLTASHNPAEYNGIKMIYHRSCLTPAQIQRLRERVEAGGFATGQGSLRSIDIRQAWLQRVCSDITLARPLSVVIDCGNAVPAVVAPQLFSRLGCQVTPLCCEVDGNFPNHHPDPTVHENLSGLIDKVLEIKADVGVAFDGDGDRVVIVTNAGRVMDTDRLLMLLVRDIVPRYEQPKVVFDVKCSRLVPAQIQESGGVAVMSRSGHSFMKQTMQESGAVVGAEFSAHVFIKDRWYGYDDGLYVAARFLEILSAGTHSAEELLQSLPESIVTPELHVAVSDEEKFQLMERISDLADFGEASINRLDGVRADFGDGWGLLRASNTVPALLLRFEADNEAAMTRIQAAFRDLLRRAAPGLPPGF